MNGRAAPVQRGALAPEDASILLDRFVPVDVRQGWAALAGEVERRQADLAALVQRLRTAAATHEETSHRMARYLGEEHTTPVEDQLRDLSGFPRLYEAAEAAGLWPVLALCGADVAEIMAEIEAKGGRS